MSFNLEAAFNSILSLNGRAVQLHDLESDTKVNVKISPANYFRNLAAFEEVVFTGKEFVISKKSLDAVSFPALKRGMRIIDPDHGQSTIDTPIPLYILGQIVGWRVRTG